MKKDIEKVNSLDTALAAIDKQYGKGTVWHLEDDEALDVDFIPSGCLGLDLALGVGGYPRGRIVEIFGPESAGKTTLALHLCAEAQKLGGKVAYIDVEHALDPTYSRAIGVNLKDCLISQPNSGEQALNITRTLIKSGEIDVIVVDSVAALVPLAELEGEVGDASVGAQARMMSKALRMIAGDIERTNTICLFINQLREKIGITFGCVQGNTLVNFTDGRSIPIKEVVEKKIEGNVWALDHNNKIVEAPIVDWHFNGWAEESSDWIHIETKSIHSRGGRFGLTVTNDHKVLTNTGWKKANKLDINDKLVSKYRSIINSTLEDFLWGCFVGDCTIRLRTDRSAGFSFQDSANDEYVQWKINKLSPFYEFKKYPYSNLIRYTSAYDYELTKVKLELGNRDPIVFLENHYSLLGLAIWIMDDAHFDNKGSHCRYKLSIKRFKNNKEKLEKITLLLNKLGFECAYSLSDGGITFTKEGTLDLAKKISRYVPEPMQYKLPAEFRGKYKEFTLESSLRFSKEYTDITTLRFASNHQLKTKGKYDLSIKDHHNYMVGGITNGVFIHNSPETTTGGRALKFYASIRLDIRRRDPIKKAEEIVGNLTKVKVVKNKVAAPFKEVEFDIVYGEGISKEGDLLDIALENGLVQKAGSWYSYNGDQLGQGREATKLHLKENPDLYKELYVELANMTTGVLDVESWEDDSAELEPPKE